MKTYNVKYQSLMGGIVDDVIANIASISFDGTLFTFWKNEERFIIAIRKECLIEFYPVPENQ